MVLPYPRSSFLPLEIISQENKFKLPKTLLLYMWICILDGRKICNGKTLTLIFPLTGVSIMTPIKIHLNKILTVFQKIYPFEQSRPTSTNPLFLILLIFYSYQGYKFMKQKGTSPNTNMPLLETRGTISRNKTKQKTLVFLYQIFNKIFPSTTCENRQLTSDKEPNETLTLRTIIGVFSVKRRRTSLRVDKTTGNKGDPSVTD